MSASRSQTKRSFRTFGHVAISVALCGWLVVAGACSDDDAESQSAADTVDGDAAGDAAADDAPGADTGAGDSGRDSPADTSFAGPEEPGSFTVNVASDAAADGGVAVRVFYPAAGGTRYEDGAPVSILVPGGHTQGSLRPPGPNPEVVANGFIAIDFLLPGGETPDGARTGGTYDYRGPDCQRALADVIAYAQGRVRDQVGEAITDRLPFALTDNVALLATSNGGNLALTTMAAHGEEFPDLRGLVAFESPIGHPYILVDLGAREGALNPLYEPGTCTPSGCPLPELDRYLAFDPDAAFRLDDPAGAAVDLRGVFFVDEDEAGDLDAGEFAFSGIAGPGPIVNDRHRPRLYLSVPVTEVIAAEESAYFGRTPPPWYAGMADTRAFWDARDGAPAIGAAHELLPDLLVMVVASREDHVQGQPDHPHIRTQVAAWLEAGHAFVRLNPDAAYMAWLSGEPASAFPDNPANLAVPYPGTDEVLLPESVDGRPVNGNVAGVLEVADRVWAGDTRGDLETVLYEFRGDSMGR
jgi:hypothetical protein